MKDTPFRLSKNISFLALILALALPFPTLAAEIHIGGTGNALGTMKLLARAYNKTHTDNKIVVLESLGSTGGIRAVSNGAIQIGLSARPLKEEQAKLGLRAIEYARAPTVFAVNFKNKRTNITVKEILAIYRGQLTHWEDGTLIRPILRQPGEDNTKQVIQLDPDMKQALQQAEKRPGLPFAVTDQDTANKMERIPGSIGVTTLPLILSEKRALHALALDGIPPTPENIAAGRYPMLKHFYYVLPKQASPATMHFIHFLKSHPGQRILRQNGHTLSVRFTP